MSVELILGMDFARILATDFGITFVEFATTLFKSVRMSIATFLFILPNKLIVESFLESTLPLLSFFFDLTKFVSHFVAFISKLRQYRLKIVLHFAWET